MRKYVLFALSLLLALPSFAQKKEENRLRESYNVLKDPISCRTGNYFRGPCQ